MQEFREELLADLHEFFHLDLLDFNRGRLPLYTIYACVRSLLKKPGQSTLLMALDESTKWNQETYLLARLSDGMELSNYLFLQANSAKDADIPMPEPLERPGQPRDEKPEPEEEFASGQELASWFNQMNNL